MTFSVVIPLYNKEISISDTVKSVLNQSYSDFELIIVNDGTTDNSLNIIKQIKDNRIKLIDKKNKGVSSARNEGIKAAKHNYIAFLDADDLWLTDHLDTLSQLIKDFPEASVFTTSFTYDKDNIEKNDNKYYITDYFKLIINQVVLSSITVAVNKECFNKVGLFNEYITRGEDIDMWARLAREFLIAKSEKCTAIYKLNAENRACSINSKIDSNAVSYYNLSGAITSAEKEYYYYGIADSLIKLYRNRQLSDIKALVWKYRYYIPPITKWIFKLVLRKIKNFSFYKLYL